MASAATAADCDRLCAMSVSEAGRSSRIAACRTALAPSRHRCRQPPMAFARGAPERAGWRSRKRPGRGAADAVGRARGAQGARRAAPIRQAQPEPPAEPRRFLPIAAWVARRMSKKADDQMQLPTHGATVLPSVRVDSYNLEVADDEGFVGDRASKSAFWEIVDKWRK